MAQLTMAEMQAQLAALQEQNEALKARQPKAPKPTCKVSAKGAVSLYGLGRFPVTLYRSQWESLLANADNIKAFIEANSTNLKVRE
jgi:hypothetical protein